MVSTTSHRLPSEYVPQRDMRCPDPIRAALRRWIDVDLLWDCDGKVWVVMEACEKPDRWGTVNGVLCEGWRRAAEYRDLETGDAYWLNELIVPWLRSRDVQNYDGDLDKMYQAQILLQEELREAAVEAGWTESGEMAYDRVKTLQQGLATGKRGAHFGGFRKG